MAWAFKDDNWKWNNSNPMGPKGIVGFNMSGGTLSNSAEVCPGTIYWASIGIEGFSGYGQLGVTWSGAANTSISSQPEKVTFEAGQSNLNASFVAPMDARYGTVWMYTTGGSYAKISKAWFGPQYDGAVSVDCNWSLRNGEQLPSCTVGVNVNYLTDNADNRKASNNGPEYVTMLKNMKVGALRYPGGEKSDYFLYAPKPFTGPPQPTLSRISANDWPSNDPTFYNYGARKWNISPMDFDTFMGICHDIGDAAPHMVLAWDTINRPTEPGGIATSAEDLKAHAMGWAKYVAGKYPGMEHFFEFSNECYLATEGAGAKAQDYANNYQWYASDLKAVNGSLRMGANGPNNCYEAGKFDGASSQVWWWPLVLKQCSQWIDFMSIHAYVIWAWDYSDYEQNALNLVWPLQEANAAIQMYADPSRKDAIRIRVTEVAPIDYGRKWSWWPATLGHALVTIDQLASSLMQPKVDSMIFWNTRWRTINTNDPQTKDNSVVNAVYNFSNNLTATGQALSFVASFFRDGWPVFASSTAKVKVFALKTMQGLRLVLINKTGGGIQQSVNISNFRSSSKPTGRNPVMYVFTGKGISDTSPGFITPNPPAAWSVNFGAGASGADLLNIWLQPYSATAFDLVPDGT